MMKRTGLMTTLVLLTVAPGVFGQDGLALMKVEAGARPAGMGGAFVAVTADPSASFYNPAGAVGTDRFNFSFGHNSYWENIRLETIYFASNATEHSWIHGGIRYASVDDLESRLIPSAEPDALFSAYDVSFKGGLARRFGDRLTIGVSLGWYIEKIDIYRGTTFNADLGALFQASPKLSFGASVTNLGPDFSLALSGHPGTDDISIPTTYRIGASYRHERGPGAVDLVIVDDKAHLHVGVERKLHEYVDLRAGYMIGYDSKSFTAGTSFRRRNLTIDYAFVPYSNSLGTSHLFNLTFIL